MFKVRKYTRALHSLPHFFEKGAIYYSRISMLLFFFLKFTANSISHFIPFHISLHLTFRPTSYFIQFFICKKKKSSLSRPGDARTQPSLTYPPCRSESALQQANWQLYVSKLTFQKHCVRHFHGRLVRLLAACVAIDCYLNIHGASGERWQLDTRVYCM